MLFRAHGIGKDYEGAPVLRGVDFSVEAGDIVSIIGPSGVGKTTLLKIIAGLETPDAGRLEFSRPPSKENPVILVFQDYVLFPNLSVYENVAFGLHVRRMRRASVNTRVMEMLDFFHMTPLAQKYPNQLSAGQRQRVAIARAMVVNPAMLLLDEPFANLDRNLKLETAEFIRDTQKAFGISTIAVTHDLEEAFAMSDKVGLILGGELVQYAPAGDVYAHPATIEAARFLGPVNTLSAPVTARLGLRDCGDNGFIRPEGLRIIPDENGPGTVERAVFAGHYTKFTISVDGERLTVFDMDTTIRPGTRVRVEQARST